MHVEVEVIANSTRLRLAYTGWRSLGVPDGRSRTLRRRFAATWVTTLEQVQSLAATTAPPAGSLGGSS